MVYVSHAYNLSLQYDNILAKGWGFNHPKGDNKSINI